MLSRRIEFSRIFLPIPIGGNVSIIPRSWRQFSTLYIFQQDSHVFNFLPPSSLLEEIQEYGPEAHFSRGQTYLGSTSTKRPIGFSSCDEKHNRIFPFSFVFNVNPRPAFFARKGKKKKNEIKVYDSLFFPSLSRKKNE